MAGKSGYAGEDLDPAMKRAKEVLGGNDLLPEYPYQQPPETPNLDIQRQSRGNSALVGLAQQFMGRKPTTLYGLKKGDMGGQVENTPGWAGAKSMAEEPWAQEQMRVQNANQLQKFYNDYSSMQYHAKTDAARRVAKLGQDIVTAQADKDVTNRTLNIQEKRLGLQETQKADDFNQRYGTAPSWYTGDKSKLTPPAVPGGIAKHLAEGRDQRLQDTQDRLQMAEERNKRMEEAQTLREKPTERAAYSYAHASLALEAMKEADEILHKNPKILRGAGLTFSGKQWRAASTEGQKLAVARSRALEGLIQSQVRRSGNLGDSLYEGAMWKQGDDPEVAWNSVRKLAMVPHVVRAAIEEKYPKFNWKSLNLKDIASRPVPFEDEERPNVGTTGSLPQTLTPERALEILKGIK